MRACLFRRLLTPFKSKVLQPLLSLLAQFADLTHQTLSLDPLRELLSFWKVPLDVTVPILLFEMDESIEHGFPINSRAHFTGGSGRFATKRDGHGPSKPDFV